MEHSNTNTITLPINQDRTHVAHSRLRAVAPQAKFVAETYRDRHPAIEVQADRVIEVSDAFILAYDASRTKSPDAAQETQELRDETRELQADIQAWMGAVVTAAPEVDLSSFANLSRSPKGIISDAQRLVEVLGKHVQGGEPIPFAQQAIAELQARIDKANKELADVLAIEAKHAEQDQRVRELGIELNTLLVGLRKTIRVVLGRVHPHYKSLLIRKRTAANGEDLAEEDDLSEDLAGSPTEGEEAKDVG